MQHRLFDQKDPLAQLEKVGDPMLRLDSTADCQAIRSLLKVIHKKRRKSNAWRKPHDATSVFGTLVLQSLYNLSND